MSLSRVYIALGSNLDEPVGQCLRAIEEIAAEPAITLVATSPLYHSAPLGPSDQPDYINAVIAIDTALPPLELLDILQQIEQGHNRVRERRWGPRTLDLDLLLYGERQIDLPRLTIPHPGLRLRNFVLLPLFDIAPELLLTDGTPIARLLSTLGREGIAPVDRDQLTGQNG